MQSAAPDDPARARDWFLKTLQIDPEDLTANHKLALVYAAPGKSQLAQRQRALRDMYRPDDHAIERAVALHRSRNPAADHAAAAIAIYDLNRAASGSSDVAAVLQPLAATSVSLQRGP